MHAPLRGIFGPNSVNVARYASLIGTKSPTKCDAHLAESNFQTHQCFGRRIKKLRRHAPYCPYRKKKRHISRRFFLCPPCCFRLAFLPCFFRDNIHLFIPKISATEPYLFSLLSEIRIHTAKHSLNRLISQLRPSVFIHNSLIIHGSRPAENHE